MNERPIHFLYPAAIHASNSGCQINTILGSCVAVCMFDSLLKTGGMNHFMLPLWNGQGLASPKYGNIAIEKLIDKMVSMGSQKRNLKAKIFGGAEVIETGISQFNIGERNINIAKELLRDHKIPVVASSVGGKNGRKIFFFTDSGAVKQRYIEKQNVIQFEKKIIKKRS